MLTSISKWAKVIGIIFIVIIGLLNFHPPHFLMENHKYGQTPVILGIGLFINALGAILSAFGIYLNKKWGWLLGIIVSCISIFLWVLQETVGLPGFPKMWFEPSRIVSFIVDVSFVIIAYQTIRRHSE